MSLRQGCLFRPAPICNSVDVRKEDIIHERNYEGGKNFPPMAIGARKRNWVSFPEEMRKRAVRLLEDYTAEAVTRELRLGRGTVRNWKLKSDRLQKVREKERPVAPAKKAVEFIEVKKPIGVNMAGPTIEWERRDGCRLRLTGCPSAELSNFIDEFLGGGVAI